MHTLSSSPSLSWEILPKDVQNLIFEEYFPDDNPIHSVNMAYRDAYINRLQTETDQKIGLYGKSLILEGFKCIREIDELQKDPINNAFIINGLSIFILKLRQYRSAEKIIYNLCGGKKEFHELKILPWEDSMKHPYGLMKIEKIKVGESIMRGWDPNNTPFIAMHVNYKKDYHSYFACESSSIIVFHQSTFDNRWNIFAIHPKCTIQQNVTIEGEKIYQRENDMYPFLRDLIQEKFAMIRESSSCNEIFKLTKQE